MHNATILSLPR